MKKMIALLLAAMLLLSLAACASTADPAPAADAAPAETTETTPAAEEAPAAETDAEAPITLTYWLPCNDLEDGAAEQKGTIAAARAFMENTRTSHSISSPSAATPTIITPSSRWALPPTTCPT